MQKKVLVIGDAMVDRYWFGKQTRKNPEGDAPLVGVVGSKDYPGGAANVAANLEALGVQVLLYSGMGQIIKHRIVDGDKIVCRFDEDSGLQPYHLPFIPQGFDAIVISDYAKGTVTDQVADKVRNANIPTYVDCKTRPDRWSGWCECMFPNNLEWSLHPHEYSRACMVVEKRGPMGASLYIKGTLRKSFQSKATSVVNVSGAGDTVVAAFVVAKLHGAGLMRCVECAMEAAAAVVCKRITTFPSLSECPDLARLVNGGINDPAI